MTAKVGGVFLERSDGLSPNAFDRVCQVFGISGLGQTNALVDATTFCSYGNREYISGLADGQEITLEANYEAEATVLDSMIADVKNKANREFRVVIDTNNDGTPEKTLYFTGTCLSWVFNPSVDNRNTISFGVKISGDIAIV